jgi:hypothetical protein
VEKFFFVFALFLLSGNIYGMSCDEQTKTCIYDIGILENTALIWSLTAQSTSTPGMEIGHFNTENEWVLLADSSVHSTDFNNRSTGNFRPPITGLYRIKFHDVISVSSETAIINGQNQVIAVTHLFVMEDGVDNDNDINDAFAVVSWFINGSIPVPTPPQQVTP